ncbi:PDR/VanB family oxidoreductase [Pseudoclavibacter soli]|uniref:PDR/VanB family oxidoreductase n=1 Tax=Pseudoclavibacter soli TaxID=452623 RepID=UPI0004264349|nr:PDR/VanB family oxidoreductase [Pseudoclavibacter soli]
MPVQTITARSLARPPVEPDQHLRLRVAEVSALGARTRHVVLVAEDGAALPTFAPGASIGIQCGAVWNSYSLTNDGRLPETYEISVQLAEAGHGGSRWVHQLAVGDMVEATTPRGRFAVPNAARAMLLVAGGIGVTAVLSHARAGAARGLPTTVLYAHRAGDDVHERELAALPGVTLKIAGSRRQLWSWLPAALRSQPIGAHLAVCGPAEMIDQVRQAALEAGWLEARVHSENFTPAELPAGDPFAVVVAGRPEPIAVPSGVTMLEALLAAEVPVPNLCRQGVCGECRLAVTCGELEHHDLYLSDDEHDQGRSVMPCVSRGVGTITVEVRS